MHPPKTKKAPIQIEDSIEELSTRTLQQAFSKAGFNVVLDEKDADLVFKGRINNFWIQEFAIYGLVVVERSEANVEFGVVLIDRGHGKNIWLDVKTSRVKPKPTLLRFTPTSQSEKVINEAFNQVIYSILSDKELVAAIDGFIRSRK